MCQHAGPSHRRQPGHQQQHGWCLGCAQPGECSPQHQRTVPPLGAHLVTSRFLLPSACSYGSNMTTVMGLSGLPPLSDVEIDVQGCAQHVANGTNFHVRIRGWACGCCTGLCSMLAVPPPALRLARHFAGWRAAFWRLLVCMPCVLPSTPSPGASMLVPCPSALARHPPLPCPSSLRGAGVDQHHCTAWRNGVCGGLHSRRVPAAAHSR